MADLSRAGIRLKGFCRTNLFKRLESSGHSFLLSLQRHILRNYIVLHAIENDLPLPIGTQDMGLLDPRANDSDSDLWDPADGDDGSDADPADGVGRTLLEADFRRRAGDVHQRYASHFRRRFKWLRPSLFADSLAQDLGADAKALTEILEVAGPWDAARDTKLHALIELVTKKHPDVKMLIFSQFADTVEFLESELRSRRVAAVAGVTGDTEDPTAVAHRFSPVSNEKRDTVSAADELRVVLATDVLSEGQNLQDCAIIVNYDLPWAIIRLIQRAGRVDRIGQKSDAILCYSFLPADGVERIIRLRSRVTERLGAQAPSPLTEIGSLEVLRPKRLGLICSVRCPGGIVIKTFDAVRQLRDAGIVVAGGFHSPMEKGCLDFLLRGEQPVIVCPPKGLGRPRLPSAWRTAFDAERLLVLSPFGDAITRTAGAQAKARNEFVAALSHAVLIPHSSPGGKAEALARHVLDRSQPLFTFDDENTELLHRGAQPYHIDRLDRFVLGESS